MPTSRTQAPTRSGGRLRLTPRASITSAAPQCELTARLPCLATGTPAAATTNEVVVETLKLPEPSPPVPTMSTSTSPAAVSIPVSMRVAFSRMTLTAPTISSMVSPFMRSPVMNEPIWAGVASPLMISFMTRTMSASLRSWRSTTLLMASRIIVFPQKKMRIAQASPRSSRA